MKKEKGISNEFKKQFNRETEVVGISKEYLAELQRDSYKADELEWTVKGVLENIIDIKWRLSLGVDINLDNVLEDIRDNLEYVLKDVNSEPEEDN